MRIELGVCRVQQFLLRDQVPSVVVGETNRKSVQNPRLLGSRNLPGVGPFRKVNNKKESVRLPEGVYRVRAVSSFINARNQKVLVETNTIDVRIDDDKPDK